MIQLCFMEIDPFCIGSVPDEMMRDISSGRRARLIRYRNELDRKLGVYAEVLVRCMISVRSGVGYRDIDIQTGQTGKPFLNGLHFEFSFSHTKNAVAAAISDKPVGVDVERIRDIDIGIAKRVFSDNELAWLNDTNENRNRRFFDIWTKKEALVKYHGTGLTNTLKSLDVTVALPGLGFETFSVDDYIAAICSGDICQKTDFTVMSEPELIKTWRNLTV